MKKHIVKAKEKSKRAAKRFQSDFKKHVVTAITAAFAFLIALVWRDAIQEGVNKIMTTLGITGTAYIYKIYVAIAITVICVVALILFSRWGAKKE